MKKRYFLILSLLIIVLSMSFVSAGLFDGFFGENDKDISLIKESTEATRNIYDDGRVDTIYSIKGVFKDLPNDIKGYNLKISLFDEQGNLMKESDGYAMKDIARNSKDSEPHELGLIYTSEYEIKNATSILLTMYNADGNIVFNKNITFNMNNMKINKLTKDKSSSSSSDKTNISKMDYDEFNEWVFNNDNGYWDSA